MEKLEDIINFKLYTYSVERFHYFESNDDTNYLEICVKQYLFKDVNLDYFEEFFNEIKGKTKEEFLEWLEEKADEQAKNFIWRMGATLRGPREFMNPVGYRSTNASALAARRTGPKPLNQQTFEE